MAARWEAGGMRFALAFLSSIVATAGVAAIALGAAGINAADLDKLTVYEKAWDDSATAAEAEARAAFSGRGGDLVEHFLRAHRGHPRTGAYAFVLRALADVEATLALVRALGDPPVPEAGATARQPAEIAALLGTLVDVPAVGGDPRVATALDALVSSAPEENRELVVAAGIALLGRCRSSSAVGALLERFAHGEARFRSMAVQAVGWMGERLAADDRPAVLAALATRLAEDRDAEVRVRAAEAIRHLELGEATTPLAAALEREASPQAVDAIVEALDALGAPIGDPARCREIAGRGFETHAMRKAFECWRASASRDQIVAAALEAPPPLRALALRALVIDPAPPESGTPLGEAPPPPTGPVDGVDEETLDRLLAAAVGLLGQDVSLSVHDATIEAASGLARGNLSRLLPATDEIAALPLRYFASWSLHRWSPRAYDRYRRERELLAAAWLALPFVVLAFAAPAARPAAAAAALAAVGWGATTFLAQGPLDLPPWPYPLAKVRFLVPLAATITACLALRAGKRMRLACLLGGPFVFLAAYLVTRGAGFYPPETLDGMLFLIEPALGVTITGPIAFALAWLGAKVALRG